MEAAIHVVGSGQFTNAEGLAKTASLAWIAGVIAMVISTDLWSRPSMAAHWVQH